MATLYVGEKPYQQALLNFQFSNPKGSIILLYETPSKGEKKEHVYWFQFHTINATGNSFMSLVP
jgi:hypothetical protein